MTEVNEELAVKVWTAADDGNSTLQVATLTGLSLRTVSRLIGARRALQKGRAVWEVAKMTGWSWERVSRVAQWSNGYDASRSPASTSVALQTAGQIALNAKEAHLDEVRRLIKDWKGCFAVRSPGDIWWAGPNPFSDIDQHPVFKQLGYHVGPKLWARYLQFRDLNNAYLAKAAQLRTTIRQSAPWGTDLPMASTINKLGLREKYGDAAFNLSLEVAAGTRSSEKLSDAYSERPLDPQGANLVALNAAGYEILAIRGELRKYQDGHIALVRNRAQSGEVQELVHQFIELSELGEAIQKDIDELLYSREYVQRTCRFAICEGAQA